MLLVGPDQTKALIAACAHVLCRVLQAATEVLHKALQTLHMKAEVSMLESQHSHALGVVVACHQFSFMGANCQKQRLFRPVKVNSSEGTPQPRTNSPWSSALRSAPSPSV